MALQHSEKPLIPPCEEPDVVKRSIRAPNMMPTEQQGQEPLASLPDELPVDNTWNGEEYDCDDFREISSTLISLTSTPKSYFYENGRRYHSYRAGSYWGPNDEKDGIHQMITHHLYCLLLRDKLFLAPLSNPQRVLDIGTGRGFWAMDFADQNPDTTVIGTDLSPEWEPVVQPNLYLEVDDCCSEWTCPPGSFDFIHTRLLYGSVSDWPKFYKNCYDHLVPGGYIEQTEQSMFPCCDDGTLPPDSIFFKWFDLNVECQDRVGKRFTIADTMKQEIANAGFENVVEKKFKIPLGKWSSNSRMKEIGRWCREFWELGMEGWLMAIATRYMGWALQDVRLFLSETKRALYDWKTHVYYESVVVYARKPQ